MSQQVSQPPEQPIQSTSQPLPQQRPPASKKGSIFLLALIGLLLLLFASLAVRNLPQVIEQLSVQKAATHGSMTQVQDQGDASLLSIPGHAAPSSLTLPAEDYIVYEQQNNIYVISASGGLPHVISTPGYIYNRAVPALLLPGGQLLYSGQGLWVTDIFGGTAVQIAQLPAGQVITAMVLSRDGTTLAWSTEPGDGNGISSIYAGPLTDMTLVYQHSASDCPCYRPFSFLDAPGIPKNTILLLTDDRGDHRGVRYGLWAFNIAGPQEPKLLLDEEPQQGPLALAPSTNTLLYSPYEGIVPPPTDGSVPDDISALNYANSLSLATIDTNFLTLNTASVVLSEQHQLSNSADYHWVATPRFSADGRTIVYVEFSSDSQAPFDRHNALYTVQVGGSGSHLQVGKPRLLATASSLLLELGPWLNNRILTFYSDGSLYALDIRTGATATIVQTQAYAHIIAVVEQG